MVARRRLKRPAKRSAHLTPRASMPLAQATIEKVGPGNVEKDVAVMNAEMEREEKREIERKALGARRARVAEGVEAVVEGTEEDSLDAERVGDGVVVGGVGRRRTLIVEEEPEQRGS